MLYRPDNWWWMYLYEHNRSPEQFAQLLDAVESGHITIALNPFVTLYGVLPTEAAICAGLLSRPNRATSWTRFSARGGQRESHQPMGRGQPLGGQCS